jgi:hypothetical protein
MDVSAILHEFTHAKDLPKDAIRAARERRSEMVPVFLEQIEAYLAARGEDRQQPTPLFFIFHLLGEWQEKSAYRPLARFLRCPRDDLDYVIGDGLIETGHRVMAAVFDGDPQPLIDIIVDPEAEEFVRSRMCETLAMAVARGELAKDVVAAFLSDAFTSLYPQEQNYVWHGWMCAIAMLGLEDLAPLVREAFDREFIDRTWTSLDYFERDLAHGKDHPGQGRWARDREYTLFGDVIEEMSSWYCFSEQYKKDQERKRHRAEEGADDPASRGQPFANLFKGVGRNDPCPCGSGKKFKKCCLH